MGKKSTKELETREEKIGFLRAANPKFSTATAIAGMFSDSSFKGIEEALKLIGDGIRSGNNAHLEELLVCQTELLNQIFIKNAHGIDQAESVPELKARAAVALKAQNQSRRTVATLMDMKNPKRATFIKNQNNAVNQQVNMGDRDDGAQEVEVSSAEAETQNLEKKPTVELFGELNNVEQMDAGKTREACQGDQAMETVGAVHRTEDGRGKSHLCEKQL